MRELKKPDRLMPGDRVAAVSLSWGGAGDPELRWRYELGKRRLEQLLGLQVLEMPHALDGSEALYHSPENRASDLMQAFSDPSIKGIFTCIGGDDSLRLLPYLDLSVIAENPKVFLGYSDSTITHLVCAKAGFTSFYGPSILAEFAENIAVYPFTLDFVKRALFEPSPIGSLPCSSQWTGDYLAWTEQNRTLSKTMLPNTSYQVLQGRGRAVGRLWGGCMDVLEMAKGTAIWPEPDELAGAVLFFETSEETPAVNTFTYWLRNYGACGILEQSAGILFGKPFQEQYQTEYHAAIRRVLAEFNLEQLPVFANGSFGHNEPMVTLPYGARILLDCEKAEAQILDSGVK
ncbi:MAG: LD-carboxypeptidase [Clostridia bacterium]|nr:LD-carboxypeptidase [Clostridia bacterium]